MFTQAPEEVAHARAVVAAGAAGVAVVDGQMVDDVHVRMTRCAGACPGIASGTWAPGNAFPRDTHARLGRREPAAGRVQKGADGRPRRDRAPGGARVPRRQADAHDSPACAVVIDEVAGRQLDVLSIDPGRGQQFIPRARAWHFTDGQVAAGQALRPPSSRAWVTAEPSPPSGWWSSATIRRPLVTAAAATSVSVSMGLTK